MSTVHKTAVNGLTVTILMNAMSTHLNQKMTATLEIELLKKRSITNTVSVVAGVVASVVSYMVTYSLKYRIIYDMVISDHQ